MMIHKFIIPAIALISLLFISCTEEKIIPDTSKDPFGNNAQNGGENPDPEPSPTSIQGLHKNIFQPRCANPTCHDGSFEPDFRTVESTWNTLVYQKVIKNDGNNSFTYRVKPGDTDMSWLIERLTTDDMILGRMPLYASPLDENQLNQIKSWISDGAKNSEGISPSFPNLTPEVLGFLAHDQNNNRLDSIRTGGFTSPFILPAGTFTRMLFLVRDDVTSTQELQNQKVKFSYLKDDFSQAIEMTPSWFLGEWMSLYFQDSLFVPGQRVYFRYYTQDSHHTEITEYPTTGTVWYMKDYYSFIIP